MNEITPTNDLAEMKIHRTWILAMIVLAGVFFITEHDLGASLVESFADTVDNLEVSAEGGNTLRRIAYVSLAMFGLLMLMKPARNQWRLASPLAILLVAFFSWCLMSIVWSTDVGLTLRRLIVLACCFIGALGISRQLRARELMTLVIVISTTFLMIGIVTEIVQGTFRPWSGDYRFSGTVHPNTQGMYLASLCLATICLARDVDRGRILLYSLFAFAFGFLILTKSRTSCGALLFVLGVLWSLNKPSKAKWFWGLTVGWVVGVVMLSVMLLGIDLVDEVREIVFLGREEQSESLSGRIPLWTELATYVAERPMIGFGYDSFWSPAHVYAVSGQMQWGIREAHSSYLETILNVGLFGLIVLLLAVLVAIGQAIGYYKKTNNPAFGFICGLLIFGLLNGLTESGMVMPLFVPFIAACCMFHLASVQLESKQQPIKERSAGSRPVPIQI